MSPGPLMGRAACLPEALSLHGLLFIMHMQQVCLSIWVLVFGGSVCLSAFLLQ